VKNGEVQLSAAGTMIDRAWREIPSQFPSIFLDDYVIMPDHLHGIVLLRGRPGSPERPAQTGLSDVIGAFKSFSTVTYARAVRDLGWPTFAGRLWQRSYFDRAIRGENDLRRIREYIRGNPLRWSTRFGTP
jgi:REP element-mobilizing transposase RayT